MENREDGVPHEAKSISKLAPSSHGIESLLHPRSHLHRVQQDRMHWGLFSLDRKTKIFHSNEGRLDFQGPLFATINFLETVRYLKLRLSVQTKKSPRHSMLLNTMQVRATLEKRFCAVARCSQLWNAFDLMMEPIFVFFSWISGLYLSYRVNHVWRSRF